MISGLTQSGAIPVLERTVQFTSARHKVLTNNIANLSTPYYKPKDLDPAKFQANLRDAVQQRRDNPQARRQGGPIELDDSKQLQFGPDRIEEAEPQRNNDNIMFHDRNNRDLERQMQSLAENTLMHRAGITMLKNEFDLLNTAIRGRV